MRYDEAVILTDLDGTLFNSQGTISKEDIAAVEQFIEKGGYFGLGTGREPNNALRFLSGMPLNGPSIVLNGAAVYDFEQERYLSCIPIDMEAAVDVSYYCREKGFLLDQQVYTTEGIFYATPLETADPGFLRIHQPTSFLPLELLKEKTWIKTVLLEREENALLPMHAYMKEKGYDKRLAVVEGTTDVVKIGKYQELLPKGINKGSAVSVLRTLPKYEGRTIFAIGDYWNDYEMLKEVDVGCCPENAIDEVKAVCAHILPSHNDSPVAYLIREVLPKL